MRRFAQARIGLALGCALGVAVAVLGTTSLFKSFEFGPFDLLMRATANAELAKSSRVKIAILSEEDLDRFRHGTNSILGSYPPPRAFWSDIIGFLTEHKVKAIVLDVLFVDPARGSVDEHPKDGVMDDDADFASALSDSGRVVLGARQIESDTIGVATPPANARVESYGPIEILPAADRLQLPIDPLATAAARIGNAHILPDAGSVVRRIAIATRVGDALVPSLPVAAAMQAFGESSLFLESGRTLKGLGGLDLPLDGHGNQLLRFRGPRGSFATESMFSIVSALTSGEKLPWVESLTSNDIVIVGVNVSGNPDVFVTPVDQYLPGPEVVATAIDNVIRGDSLWRPSIWLRLAIDVAMGALTGLLALAIQRQWVALLLVVPQMLGYATLTYFLFKAGFVLDVVAPLSASAFTYLGVALYLYRTEGKKKKEIRRMFSQYLSADLVAELVEHPDALKLGGEKRTMTVFFSDIAGFTGISEKMQPEELVAFLNEYLTLFTDTILDSGGTIDKYIGDAVMAFWGAPVARPDHAQSALAAAARCRAALERFTIEKSKQGLPPLNSRMGIHTGPVIVGNCGSARRFNYTVLGDTVNLSSRLEGANKFFGSGTMVTDEVLASAGPGAGVTRRLAKLRVKGRANPVGVHELLGAGGAGLAARAPWVDRFEAGLAAFESGDFAAADREFAAADAGRDAGDPPAQKFRELCAKFQKSRPDGFDGVLTLEEK